tara:strand:- start:884 stop:1123 length:240 start_codon:yes stop_codon:yes gene_type:complete
MKKVVNGVHIDLTTEEEKEFLEESERNLKAAKKIVYKIKRKNEYPLLHDQLDMIYHDKMDGTNLWVELISGVKAKYPKP